MYKIRRTISIPDSSPEMLYKLALGSTVDLLNNFNLDRPKYVETPKEFKIELLGKNFSGHFLAKEGEVEIFCHFKTLLPLDKEDLDNVFNHWVEDTFDVSYDM